MTPDEHKELIEAVTAAMTASIGPTGDMHRAVIAANVDGLIDAYKRLQGAAWPEWMIHSVIIAMVTGQATPIVMPSKD